MTHLPSILHILELLSKGTSINPAEDSVRKGKIIVHLAHKTKMSKWTIFKYQWLNTPAETWGKTSPRTLILS